MRCLAAFFAVLSILYRVSFEVSHQVPALLRRVFPYYFFYHKKCTPSSAQPSYTSSLNSAAPCGAVPCPAVGCCAVLRCAFVRTYSSTRYQAKYQGPVCACVIVFSLSFHCPLSVLMCICVFFCKLHPCCRRKRDINKHTAQQYRAMSSAQAAFGIFKSLGAFCPLHMFGCVLSCFGDGQKATPCLATNDQPSRYISTDAAAIAYF